MVGRFGESLGNGCKVWKIPRLWLEGLEDEDPLVIVLRFEGSLGNGCKVWRIPG